MGRFRDLICVVVSNSASVASVLLGGVLCHQRRRISMERERQDITQLSSEIHV